VSLTSCPSCAPLAARSRSPGGWWRAGVVIDHNIDVLPAVDSRKKIIDESGANLALHAIVVIMDVKSVLLLQSTIATTVGGALIALPAAGAAALQLSGASAVPLTILLGGFLILVAGVFCGAAISASPAVGRCAKMRLRRPRAPLSPPLPSCRCALWGFVSAAAAALYAVNTAGELASPAPTTLWLALAYFASSAVLQAFAHSPAPAPAGKKSH